jgi:hypothetical protein
MAAPTTFVDYRLSSAALEETELMVGQGTKRLRAVPIHSNQASCTRRISPSGRWCETRPALVRVAPSPTINSDLSIAVELRCPSRRVVSIRWSSVFVFRDCRPSGRWREMRTNLRRIAPFVRMRELRRHVTLHHRRSVLHVNPIYVACLQSELSRIGTN